MNELLLADAAEAAIVHLLTSNTSVSGASIAGASSVAGTAGAAGAGVTGSVASGADASLARLDSAVSDTTSTQVHMPLKRCEHVVNDCVAVARHTERAAAGHHDRCRFR